MKPFIVATLLVWFGWAVGVCPAQPQPSESSLRERLAKLRAEVTPQPDVPPMPSEMKERGAYMEKVLPLWAPYWEKENARLRSLAGVCEELITAFPATADAATLEREMADSYIQALGSTDPHENKARERIHAWLARPDLRADTAEQFYGFQMNMIAIISGGGNLDEIVPVPRNSNEIPDRIREVVEKFAARYPASPALGRLCFSAASFLEPRRSFASATPPELREKFLQQAEQFGDEATRRDAAKVRFRTAAVGQPAPPVVFTALDGRKVDLAELKGKVVVLDFWATWCGPCVDELPKIRALYERDHDRGLEIIGISLDGEQGKLEGFVRDQSLPWPQYFDGAGWESAIGQRFGVRAIPETWVIDREGRVAAISPDNLGKMIETQLAK